MKKKKNVFLRNAKIIFQDSMMTHIFITYSRAKITCPTHYALHGAIDTWPSNNWRLFWW